MLSPFENSPASSTDSPCLLLLIKLRSGKENETSVEMTAKMKIETSIDLMFLRLRNINSGKNFI